MKTLVRLDRNRKVNAQWETDHDPEPGLMDVTNHPDGPNFLDRTHDLDTDTFSDVVVPAPTRRQELKEITTWTDAERLEANDEAIRGLL